MVNEKFNVQFKIFLLALSKYLYNVLENRLYNEHFPISDDGPVGRDFNGRNGRESINGRDIINGREGRDGRDGREGRGGRDGPDMRNRYKGDIGSGFRYDKYDIKSNINLKKDYKTIYLKLC